MNLKGLSDAKTLHGGFTMYETGYYNSGKWLYHVGDRSALPLGDHYVNSKNTPSKQRSDQKTDIITKWCRFNFTAAFAVMSPPPLCLHNSLIEIDEKADFLSHLYCC